MPRFAANLSMMYTEYEFPDRFAAAAKDGFTGVEYLFPYEWPAADLAKWLDAAGLQQVLFNAPPGEWERNERGTAALPGRQEEFRAGIRRALEYAAALHCPRIHVMAGLVPPNGDRAEMRATYLANLRWACDEAHRAGRKLLLEPINTRDIPGFFLNRQDEAHAVVAEVGSASLQVQMDLYHCQIVEGDLATKIRRYVPTGNVGHIQVAGVPDRHEPGLGVSEVNFPYLFRLLDSLAYDGWVGCEYRPAAGTSEGLGWLRSLAG
jgi:hydroxypyruvate isomerase